MCDISQKQYITSKKFTISQFKLNTKEKKSFIKIGCVVPFTTCAFLLYEKYIYEYEILQVTDQEKNTYVYDTFTIILRNLGMTIYRVFVEGGS